MNLVSGSPFWPAKDSNDFSFAMLDHDIKTEVLVVGGGITSALVCLAFYQAGIQIALVTDERVGHGSTSASTALLQYEIDVDLYELKEKIGAEEAVKAYQLCGGAIHSIQKIGARFQADFAYRPSIYLAAKERDADMLQKEYSARKEAGFEVDWLHEKDIENYGLHAPVAIYSKLGAEVDPYKLTRQIFLFLKEHDVPIFERTGILFDQKDGRTLRTGHGHRIHAQHTIFASGYKSQSYLVEKVVKLQSTYAFVSTPLSEQVLWKERALWWDNDAPYLYARTTVDNRVMIGGGDRFFHQKSLRDLFHRRQIRSILQKVRAHYEWNGDMEYSWNGVFGETKDGLAYIRQPKDWKHADFALGFGGNGITYSQLAAAYLVRKYQGEQVSELALFRFGR